MTATAPLIIHYSKKYLLKQDIKKEPRTSMFRFEVLDYLHIQTRKLTVFTASVSLFLCICTKLSRFRNLIKKSKNALNMSFSNYLMCYLFLLVLVINS